MVLLDLVFQDYYLVPQYDSGLGHQELGQVRQDLELDLDFQESEVQDLVAS